MRALAAHFPQKCHIRGRAITSIVLGTQALDRPWNFTYNTRISRSAIDNSSALCCSSARSISTAKNGLHQNVWSEWLYSTSFFQHGALSKCLPWVTVFLCNRLRCILMSWFNNKWLICLFYKWLCYSKKPIRNRRMCRWSS